MVKKSRIPCIALMVLAVFLLFVCSKKKSTEPEPTKDKWTILGYFDGNNKQDVDTVTNSSYMIRDVQDMEQVGSSENVQIIVMLSSINTEGNCNYYFIEKQLGVPSTDSIRSKVLESRGKEDMSDPQTLRDFITYGVEHYPADHYMLIINDRGSGWKGVCSDHLNGDGMEMTLPELDVALSGYNFEIILLNTPYSSMVEVAYQLKDEANYLVASQFNIYGQNILSSSKWLQSLANNPGMSSRDLARNITIEIHTTAVADPEVPNASVSAIDLSQVDALTSKIADFGSLLVSHTGDHWNEVLDARETLSYLTSYYFDLKRFSQNIQNTSAHLDSTIKSAAQAVESATEVAVVKTWSKPEYLDYGGLSIHFPFESDKFDSTRYVQLAFAVFDWHIFLSEFIQAYIEANKGSIRIVSEPVKGARIYLDEEDTGFETDTTIHGIPAGLHTIKVVKAGWHMTNNQALEIDVEAGETDNILIRLFQDSPPGESIYDISEL